jgi:hypothetical protein
MQLDALVASLRATPGVIGQPPQGAIELSLAQHEELQGVIQRLQELLEQDDSEAQTLWEAHAAGLHAMLGQADLLELAIGGYDFEEALRLLTQEA